MHLRILLLFLEVTCNASSLFHEYVQKHHHHQPIDDTLDQTVLSSYEILKQEWNIFKQTHSKKYDSEEENLKRMQIFAQNKLFIAKHNDLYENDVVSFTMGINQFSDLTNDEFNEKYGMKIDNVNYEDHSNEDSLFLPLNSMKPPDEKDWRKDGAVTRVRNQEECASCWAFSAVGALEGQYFLIKKKGLVEMSEQNLIDCSIGYGNWGCSGGLPIKAFRYTKTNGGIDTEKNYPYEGRNDTCRYVSKNAVEGPVGSRRIENSEEELKIYVGLYGPVSVVIDAHGDFKDYKKGVYLNAKCSSHIKDLNHAMLVVGYGVEDGKDYWLVKNSYGEGWGENGYIKMARNRNNHCGIVTQAVIPIFKE